jgi:hypothetical protein
MPPDRCQNAGVPETRATEAVDHLQSAALELIEAARAFLDVLEELVADRERLGEAADVVGAAAGAAARIVGFGAPVGPDGAPTAPAQPADASPSPVIERIPVS